MSPHTQEQHMCPHTKFEDCDSAGHRPKWKANTGDNVDCGKRCEEQGAKDSGARPIVHDEKEIIVDHNSPAFVSVRLMGDLPDHIIQLAIEAHFLETGETFKNATELFLAAEQIAKSPEKQAFLVRKLHLAKLEAEKKTQLANIVEEDGAAVKTDEVVVKTDEVVVKAEEAAEEKDKNKTTEGDAIAQFTDNEEDEKAKKAETAPTAKVQLLEKVRKLTAENQKLERRKKCRVCRKVDLAVSGVTFLPCGHYLVCETCAEACDECPACGKSIMGTVRTFLA